ncbi:MAG: hypothetical protein MUF22_02655, partial [Chitinispirillaceae bacterium]|nr:hypothetical protein [Chitinispirillaceae bacterium]
MTNFPLTDFLFSWSEYRRFYRLSSDDRGIVFYAETGQDFHHFAGIIDRITHLERKSVCYVTSQRNDNIFSLDNPKIKPFYIRAGLLRIIFFQNLRCDLFVLTMTDLGSMHLKRSVNPVHYAYIFHAMGSTHMVDFADSYDHYDTILCSGPHQIREIRRREEMAKLPAKQLIEHGYARIDALIAE